MTNLAAAQSEKHSRHIFSATTSKPNRPVSCEAVPRAISAALRRRSNPLKSAMVALLAAAWLGHAAQIKGNE